jgi:hypothetical protein
VRLNAAERLVRSAFPTGAVADLRGVSGTVRASVLADLLARPVDRAAHPRAAMRIRSATIVGGLDLRAAEVTVPVAIGASDLAGAVDLSNARLVDLALTGCTVGAITARLVDVRGDACLYGNRLVVAGSMYLLRGFRAIGDVILIHARVGSQLNFTGSELATTGEWALHLGGAQVGSLWLTFASVPVGRVRLSGLRADTIFDDPRVWPDRVDLVGCEYRLLIGRLPAQPGEPMPVATVPVRQRLELLRRSPDGYAPQPYEQLAATYRQAGQDQEARRVLLERQRRRRATLPPLARVPGYLLDGLVGYGYRTWLASCWLALFWLLGTVAFIADPPTPHNPATAPDRNPALQALDLLLPVIDLGHDGAWNHTGANQYVAAVLILAGWVLTTAVVAGVTRVVNR